MGVRGLWKILEPTGRETSFMELSLQEGFMKKPNKQLYRIGVDISLWFFNALATHGTENHELQLIFFRMVRFLRHPCQILFVFDGPGRPLIKRGHTRSQKFHWLEESTKKLADAFGFSWIQAPGEAEAELAYLNRIGQIDAVLSEDVDTLIFGAKTVLRSAPVASSDAQFDRVVVYDADVMCTQDAVPLSRCDLILMAMLIGGDYDEGGLEGCGTSVALGLVQSGLGKRLYDAASLPDDTRHAALSLWREELATELASNKSKFLNRVYPSVAASIRHNGASFPDPTILGLYLKPLISKVQTNGPTHSGAQSYKMPDVSEIASCCELYFQWGSEQGIIDRFESLLFEGISLHSLVSSSMDRPSTLQPGPLIQRLERTRLHSRTLSPLVDYRAEINPTEIINLIKSGLQGLRKPSTSPSRSATTKSRQGAHVRVWLPGPLVEAALPSMVKDFSQRKSPHKKVASTRKTKSPKSKASVRTQEHGVASSSASQRRVDHSGHASPEEIVTICISSDDEHVPIRTGTVPRTGRNHQPIDVIDLTNNSDSD